MQREPLVRVIFNGLPADVQKKYGYDAKSAQEFQQQQYQADVLRREKNARRNSKNKSDLNPSRPHHNSVNRSLRRCMEAHSINVRQAKR